MLSTSQFQKSPRAKVDAGLSSNAPLVDANILADVTLIRKIRLLQETSSNTPEPVGVMKPGRPRLGVQTLRRHARP
jgi:hypothetical protein